MKLFKFILFSSTLLLSLSLAAQQDIDQNSSTKIQKWTTSGDEALELLQDLGLEGQVEIQDGETIEIIKIQREHPSFFGIKGLDDIAPDFPDLKDLKGHRYFKLYLDDNGNVQEYEWDGEGDLPDEIQKQLEQIPTFDLDSEAFGLWRDKAFLGVYLENTEDAQGVLVTDVIKNTPAEQAGIQAGDLITQIEDQTMHDVDQLTQYIQSLEPGQDIDIRIHRNGKSKLLHATLRRAKDKNPRMLFPHFWENTSKNKTKVKLGIRLADELLEIKNVVPGSAADKAGLQIGDLIKSLDGQKVDNFDELKKVLRNKKSGDKIMIKYVRDGKTKHTEATLKADKQHLGAYLPKMRFLTPQQDDEDIFIIKRFNKSDRINQSPDMELELNVFPNPSGGTVNISFVGSDDPGQIRIVGLDGREYYSETVRPKNGKIHKEIILQDQPSGTLILKIQQAERTITGKILLQDD